MSKSASYSFSYKQMCLYSINASTTHYMCSSWMAILSWFLFFLLWEFQKNIFFKFLNSYCNVAWIGHFPHSLTLEWSYKAETKNNIGKWWHATWESVMGKWSRAHLVSIGLRWCRAELATTFGERHKLCVGTTIVYLLTLWMVSICCKYNNNMWVYVYA